jgi:hypothetical protein
MLVEGQMKNGFLEKEKRRTSVLRFRDQIYVTVFLLCLNPLFFLFCIG